MSEIVIPELNELTFEENSHTYKLNGIIIPSVSTIMEPLNHAKYSGIKESTLAAAAEKGTIVHNAIENWIKFGIEDVPSEYKGYFDCFLEFWNMYSPEVIGSELRIYHKQLSYGGTIDLLANISGELTLVDYKSVYTVSEMTCGVQLEAYSQALTSHAINIQKKKILHLTKNGKMDIIDFPVKDAQRWRVFGALKTVYDYSHQK